MTTVISTCAVIDRTQCLRAALPPLGDGLESAPHPLSPRCIGFGRCMRYAHARMQRYRYRSRRPFS
ncbi:hypothetical protein AWV79_35925 [Cupriavidus sp. UYMMa02A]|nr:hypothetical protein AWV79_35925 [Cupriavidus sp. UYMMa02A]